MCEVLEVRQFLSQELAYPETLYEVASGLGLTRIYIKALQTNREIWSSPIPEREVYWQLCGQALVVNAPEEKTISATGHT